jgi:hypothetical protein
MGMKRIIVELSNERLTTPSGLTLAGAMLDRSGLATECNRASMTGKRAQPQMKNGDILLTYLGLLCQGKTPFESVREMEDDPDFYEKALGIVRGIPSAESLRARMDEIGSSLRNEILRANINMFAYYGIQPSPLSNGYVPLDIDVTPFDNSKTKKEGVSRTYKGFDGYAPIMAYAGTEGFLVNTELRCGKQHCQNGTPDFLRETLALSRKMTDAKLLVRLDSGNDAAENIGILLEDGASFIIKRNPRRGETGESWIANVMDCCEDVRSPREGKTVYVGSSVKRVSYKNSESICTADVRIVYEVIVRTIDRHGQLLIAPDIEFNTWWTDLGLTDNEIINLYHAHGESEQYHSEIKTDMDVERLPSGKFDTNELVLELVVLAYNILRMMGQESLKADDSRKMKRPVRRRRLRTVIGNLILIAGHVKEHGRKTFLALGRSNVWRYPFMRLYHRFAMS